MIYIHETRERITQYGRRNGLSNGRKVVVRARISHKPFDRRAKWRRFTGPAWLEFINRPGVMHYRHYDRMYSRTP